MRDRIFTLPKGLPRPGPLRRQARAGAGARAAWLAAAAAGGTALGLAAGPALALHFWFVLAAPPVAAAALLGVRGAIGLWGFSGAALAGSLAAGAQPSPPLAQAAVGVALLACCSLLAGLAVDRRNHAAVVLQRTAGQFQRFICARVADAIVQHEGNADLAAFSARREVTVLFCDLRGFTALAERMEPESVVLLLNEFFDAMTAEVTRYGGTPDKYIGDEVMAFFGDGGEGTDHAERAVRCGLAMQQRMRELNARWLASGRETIYMGVGISTGVGVVGNIGSTQFLQYTAIGSMVNVASRLADLAKPGQILATRQTMERVAGRIASLGLEPVAVKGIPTPVEVAEVIGSRGDDAPGGLAPSRAWLDVVGRVIDDPAFRAVLLRSPQEATRWYRLTEDERAMAAQVATLCGYPLFQGVPAEELATLIALSAIERRRQGELVVTEGAADDRMFLTLQGELFVTRSLGGAGEEHVASLGTGDTFGEQALVFDERRSASVRAASDCTFLVLHRQQFSLLLERAPVLRSRIEAIARSRTPRHAQAA